MKKEKKEQYSGTEEKIATIVPEAEAPLDWRKKKRIRRGFSEIIKAKLQKKFKAVPADKFDEVFEAISKQLETLNTLNQSFRKKKQSEPEEALFKAKGDLARIEALEQQLLKMKQEALENAQ